MPILSIAHYRVLLLDRTVPDGYYWNANQRQLPRDTGKIDRADLQPHRYWKEGRCIAACNLEAAATVNSFKVVGIGIRGVVGR